MGIFTRLFKGGNGDDAPDERDDDGAPEREQSVAGAELVAAAGGSGFALAGPGKALMTAKPDAPRPRTPLPGVPRQKEPAPEPPVVAEEKPVNVTFKKPKPDKNDATMVMTPPPPVAPPAATAPAKPPAPLPRAPAPAPPPARKKPDSIDLRLDEVVLELSEPIVELDVKKRAPSEGVSTASDLSAVRKLFEEVAVAHVAQVRDVMLELRFGEADPRWIEMTKPALQSLRAMAKHMELIDLTASLDAFCAAVEAAVAARVIDEAGHAELFKRYERLIELIPQAFELDAERDRREPIIVEALLNQIDGVERPTIDKLFAVGLNRLEVLIKANAGDVAAVSGLRVELAAKIVDHFQAYRASANATVAAPDPHTEHRKLADLLVILSLQNDDFNKVSTEWTDEANQRKRALRKQRDQTFQQIKVSLARLGERDQLVALEKLTFNDRIATIDRWLSAKQAQAPRH
jgi:outer membrane biosynthesis protein TonB